MHLKWLFRFARRFLCMKCLKLTCLIRRPHQRLASDSELTHAENVNSNAHFTASECRSWHGFLLSHNCASIDAFLSSYASMS